MSSYLSIYGVERATDNKLLLVSYSRSNGVYQAINDNMSVVFDNGEEPQYSEITLENITDAMDDVKKDIDDANRRINEFEKIAFRKVDSIDEESLEKMEEEQPSPEYDDYVDENEKMDIFEIVNEILSWKEYVDELYCTYYKLEFILNMLDEIEYNDESDFSKIVCNIN